ncbi:uncharacterized protein LOC102722938 isoform X2 [Oryza brachyantha]|uniref:uncharacterized protein LOC102722938 isoform X2 n=1 Tax=Oryza brachyantha TaxID=4533 RepID=UPI0007767E3F|nr:uncharacterized protein LOC102722938 isoform X2 [Oryza brachyantha]
MSRCFPYPPPGYVRNPVVAAAEAEATTKKEREKAGKKKEKKSDKKALQQGEVSKHSKRTHKKRKHEDIIAADQKPRKGSNEPVEQLEKSGLTEELGAPSFVQTVHGSPESSQDSSKRRKVVLPSPSQAKNGNILRIKIRRDQDSSSASLSEKSNVEHTPVQQMGSVSSLPSKKNPIQAPNNKVMVRSASAQQQNIKSDSQAVLKQSIPTPAKVMHRVDVTPSMRVGLPPVELTTNVGPSLSKAKQTIPPAPAKVTQRVDLPHAKALQRPAKVSHRVDPLPSKVQIDATPSFSKLSHRENKSEVQPFPQNLKVPVGMPTINQQHTDASQPKEEPSFSGRSAEPASVPVEKQSKSDRKKSRKAEKKEKKFKDLFVTWDPPSIGMEDTNLGDQDWLFGSTRKPDAGTGNCREIADPVSSQSAEQFLLQPRAMHLPDLHVYQLPYVVPF